MSEPLNRGQEQRVIRFLCPHCATNLKAPADRVGGQARCPQCRQRSPVPVASAPLEELKAGALPIHEPEQPALPVRAWYQVVDVIGEMSPPVRWIFFGTAGLSLLCLALLLGTVVVNWREPTGPHQHVLVIGGTVLAMIGMAILHGHGTRCPSCCRWWAKKDTGNELVDSDVRPAEPADSAAPVEKTKVEEDEGKRVIKVVTFHHKHQCTRCGHRWTTTFTDKYQSTIRRRQSSESEDELDPSQRHSID